MSELTEDRLRGLYCVEGLSATDIARQVGCSRQYIYQRLRLCGLAARSLSAARVLALERGKISFVHTDETGAWTMIKHKRNTLDRDFFKSWSPGMAWVLGVVCTDGNLYPGRLRTADHLAITPRLTVDQKEPEILEKTARLMRCETTLRHQKKHGIRGELYTLEITDPEIYRDLLALGLTPRKSETLRFPPVPQPLWRDFIRGCWDGDGTVYFREGRRGVAAFGSASSEFVDAIVKNLCLLGMPEPPIYSDSRSPSYRYFRYAGRSCVRLFHLLYDDVDPSMYLNRKYEMFKEIADKSALLFQ